MDKKQNTPSKKAKFNFHIISTVLLVLIFITDFQGSATAAWRTIFPPIYNSFGDADVTIEMPDTTYVWKAVLEGTFRIEDIPCEKKCIRKLASAKLKTGEKYMMWDVTDYKKISVDWLDREGGNVHY